MTTLPVCECVRGRDKDNVLPCSSLQSGCAGSAAQQHAGGSLQSLCNWWEKAPCCAWSNRTSINRTKRRKCTYCSRAVTECNTNGNVNYCSDRELLKTSDNLSLQWLLRASLLISKNKRTKSVHVHVHCAFCGSALLCSLLHIVPGKGKGVFNYSSDTFHSRPLHSPPALHSSHGHIS